MRHILGSFDSALKALRDRVLLMASLTEASLDQASQALFHRDFDACNTVLAEDERIDQLEMQIDHEGVQFMARFQPMATDLRHVVAAMKVGSNLERVGDQAVSIARRARNLNQSQALPETATLQPMFRMAAEMLRDSLRSYADHDDELARSLKQRDRQLDLMHHQAIQALTARMAADPGRIEDYLDLVFIARFIERIGDHATNIAEDAVFAVAAEDIRHSARSAALA